MKFLWNNSIRSQFFRSYIVFIVFLVSFIILCNFFLLEKFYISHKLSELKEMTEDFETLWVSDDVNTLVDFIQELENRYSVVIDFRQSNQARIYSTRLDGFKELQNNVHFGGSQVQVRLSKEDMQKFYDGRAVTFQTGSRDSSMQVIGATKQFADGEMVILHVTVESIQESINLMNRFIFGISILLLIFGWFWSKSFSDRFTKPILSIQKMSEKISKLDFSARWREQREDELGDLGETMNTLSDILDESIQEIKRQNAQLEAELRRKDMLEEMRKAFISDVSHELKTPIALIQGYAEGLLYNVNQDAKDREEYCAVILDEAKQMSRLVIDLLFISKLESGAEPLNRERFYIQPLISGVCEKLETVLSPHAHVSISVPNVEVSGDYRKIERVLTNLLTNAYKYVNDQGVIRLTAQEANGKLRIQIYNSCDNLSEEELEKIWISFYKVDKARNREQTLSSTGLGLSIVKKLMDLHEEACGARNIEDGVEFWFDLPVYYEK